MNANKLSKRIAIVFLTFALIASMFSVVSAEPTLSDIVQPLTNLQNAQVNADPREKIMGLSDGENEETEITATVVFSKDLAAKALPGILRKLERYTLSHGPLRELPAGDRAIRTCSTAKNLLEIAEMREVTSIVVLPKAEVPDMKAMFEQSGRWESEINMFKVRGIIGVTAVESILGLNGTGVNVAVVDTGVDYAHPDLFDSLSYSWEYMDNHGWVYEPVVFDADESQVLLMEGYTRNATGYLLSSGTYVRTLVPYPVDILITKDYYVPWVSKSGIYKLGMTYQPICGWYRMYPVLMFDPWYAGDYTWAGVDLDNDGSFADDMLYYYGSNRVTMRDFNGDDFPDVTAGTLGGYFYDLWWHFSFPGEIHPGWDRNGEYMSIFYDFYGHGTCCAGNIASRGKTVYDIFPFGKQRIRGVAPGATIVGVKALWMSNWYTGMLWAAGFNIDQYGRFQYSGAKRAHIISNSWGLSEWYDLFGFGYDLNSMFENGLTMPGFISPNFPGIIVVHAAGNGGPGYGTITAPGAASAIITVGASTATHTMGFDGTAYKYDDVVSWSARAPTPIGEVKPDVVNVGAFAFDIAPICQWWVENQGMTIFGGTSQATPLTAGVAALILQGAGTWLPHRFVRQVLQNTARHLHPYNALVQGAGRVDAYNAVLLAQRLMRMETPETPATILYGSVAPFKLLAPIVEDAWQWQWENGIPLLFLYGIGAQLQVPSASLPAAWKSTRSGSLFLGRLKPGSKMSFGLTITNPMPSDGEVYSFAAEKEDKVNSTFIVSSITPYSSYMWEHKYHVISECFFGGSQLAVFKSGVLFEDFDPELNYYNNFAYMLDVFDWVDADKDGIIDDPEELVGYNYDDSWGTTHEVPVRYIAERLRSGGKIVVRVSAIATFFKAVPYYLWINTYRRVGDPKMTFKYASISIPAGGTVTQIPTLSVPTTDRPGVHEGFISFCFKCTIGGKEYRMKSYIPYTYVVVASLGGASKDKPITITSSPSYGEVLYDLGQVEGLFDWAWRYESGDWRVYAVEVRDPSTFALEVTFNWLDQNSTIDIFTLGPNGQYAGHYWDQGVTSSFWYGGGVFGWHNTAKGSNKMALRTVTFPQTSYTADIYGFYPPYGGPVSGWPYLYSWGWPYPFKAPKYHLRTPAVFTIYVHETLHGGHYPSEPIVGTVAPYKSPQRYPANIWAGKPYDPIPLRTAIELPYVAAVYEPTYSYLGAYPPAPVSIYTGTEPCHWLYVYPEAYSFSEYIILPSNTLISTCQIGLCANAYPCGCLGPCQLWTDFETHMPSLARYERYGSGLYLTWMGDMYFFQDWTNIYPPRG